MTTQKLLGCVGVIGLLLVGVGTLVVLNRNVVFERLGAMLDGQAEKTQVTLFRLGEVMSIGSEVKEEFGVEPDVTYDTETGPRILIIVFGKDQLSEERATEGYAREIATFAIGQRTRYEQIDLVRVKFVVAEYEFVLDDLLPVESSAESD